LKDLRDDALLERLRNPPAGSYARPVSASSQQLRLVRKLVSKVPPSRWHEFEGKTGFTKPPTEVQMRELTKDHASMIISNLLVAGFGD